MVYITDQGKQGILKYKYNGADGSYISSAMQPFWNWSASLLPKWIAPNMVTLLGFFGVVIHWALTLSYCPNIKCQTEIPSWVWFLNVFLIFWYQTLDAIDGKHARATGTSSPLGELFDHGCDSITLMFQTIALLISIQLESKWWSMVLVMVVCTEFQFSIWEQYRTNTLRFSEVAGPTEGILLIMIIHTITGFMGTGWWNTPFALYDSIKWNQALVILFLVGSMGEYFRHIYAAYSVKLTSAQKAIKGHFLRPLFAWVILVGGWLIWAIGSPEDLLEKYPMLMFSLFGTLNGFLCTRCCLARVCNEKIHGFYLILLPLPIISFITVLRQEGSGFSFLAEGIFDWWLITGYFTFVIICYSHMVVSVIGTICKHLNINCLTIKTK